MNDLLQTHTLLAAGLRADPLLALASTVVWLDPLWDDDDDDWDVPQDEDGTLAIALRVIRTAFPDVYVQAVEAVRRSASYGELDRMICNAITERGIPLDNLEWIDFGVPMPAYGVVLDDPDLYTEHPDTIPVLACFGISPEPNPSHINVPDCAYTAGRLIAADLQRHEDENYRQVSWLMQWLFSCSNNSSIDYDYESMCEFQPLSWEADELAFAIEIIEEADGIMADALAGLAFIKDQPDLLAALQHNVRRIDKVIEKQKGTNNEPRIRLAWPHLAGGTERTAKSVA
jgi:hypothetical protein